MPLSINSRISLTSSMVSLFWMGGGVPLLFISLSIILSASVPGIICPKLQQLGVSQECIPQSSPRSIPVPRKYATLGALKLPSFLNPILPYPPWSRLVPIQGQQSLFPLTSTLDQNLWISDRENSGSDLNLTLDMLPSIPQCPLKGGGAPNEL